jgi:hypothetical protein
MGGSPGLKVDGIGRYSKVNNDSRHGSSTGGGFYAGAVRRRSALRREQGRHAGAREKGATLPFMGPAQGARGGGGLAGRGVSGLCGRLGPDGLHGRARGRAGGLGCWAQPENLRVLERPREEAYGAAVDFG